GINAYGTVNVVKLSYVKALKSCFTKAYRFRSLAVHFRPKYRQLLGVSVWVTMALRLNLRGRVDDAVSARRYCALIVGIGHPWARWGRHAEVAQYCSSASFTQGTFWVDV
ncbi:hypothetical protein G3M48_002740, partial [Beauveria asiatica]